MDTEPQATTAGPQDLFTQFCEAFGDKAEIEKKIKLFWNAPRLPGAREAIFSPIAAYEHLMDGWVAEGKISVPRAAALKRYFRESYAPEKTTGYLPKHREPLVEAFAEAYARAHPQSPLLRVAGDVMNLGGLNEAIIRAGGSWGDADAVIRVMTDILRRKLASVGEVIPIRHGGDELSLYVQPKQGVNKEGVQRALGAAEQQMADFICEAGLRNAPHTKLGKPPGVGIGCAVSEMMAETGKPKSLVALTEELEAGIDAAKKAFQDKLGEAKPFQAEGKAAIAGEDGKYSTITSKKVKVTYNAPLDLAVLRGALSKVTVSAENASSFLLSDDKDYSGSTPENAREGRLRNYLIHKGHTALSLDEDRLIASTVALTRKFDFVTGLPEFLTAEKAVAPNFRARFGEAARVVVFDFNNMGGGNRLGPWVGDAMARAFTRSIQAGMENVGLGDYLPYLMSQGGGRFTLLLPPEKCDDKQSILLSNAVERALQAESGKDLLTTIEEKNATRSRIAALENEQIAQRQGTNNMSRKRGDQSTLSSGNDAITLAHIKHTRSRREGSVEVMVSDEVNLSAPGAVFREVSRLEAHAKEGHDAIAHYEQTLGERVRKGEPKHPSNTDEKYRGRRTYIDKPIYKWHHGAEGKLERQWTKTIRLTPAEESPTPPTPGRS